MPIEGENYDPLASQQSKDGPRGLKLTDLPEELQYAILENLLLVIPEPFVLIKGLTDKWDASIDRATDFDQQLGSTGMFKYNDNVLRQSYMGALHPAILRVNKSLHAIGEPLLMKNEVFTISSPFSLKSDYIHCFPSITFWKIRPQHRERVRPMLHLEFQPTLSTDNATRKTRVLMFDCRDLSTVLFLLEAHLRAKHVRERCCMISLEEGRCIPNSPFMQILSWHCETTLLDYIKGYMLVKRCLLRDTPGIIKSQRPEVTEWIDRLSARLWASDDWCKSRDLGFDFRPAAHFIMAFLSKVDAFLWQDCWPENIANIDSNPFAATFEVEASNAYRLRLTLGLILDDMRKPRRFGMPHSLYRTLRQFCLAAGSRMDYSLGMLAFRGPKKMPPTFENTGNFIGKEFMYSSQELLASSCVRAGRYTEPALACQDAHANFCQAALFAYFPLGVDGLQRARRALHRSLLQVMPAGDTPGKVNKPWYKQKRKEFKALKADWMGKDIVENVYKKGRRLWWLDRYWRWDFYRSLEPWWEQMKVEKWGGDMRDQKLVLEIE